MLNTFKTPSTYAVRTELKVWVQEQGQYNTKDE